MTEKEQLAQRLKEVGLRLTPQRLAIYQTLVETDAHPTAHDLYERLDVTMPSLSQATVYNTLQVLVAHGLVHELGDAGDGTVHYDANVRPHVNLVCTRCHRIEDYFYEPLAGLDERVALETGYQVQGARLVFYGLCPQCQAEHAA